jgi:hypothetical protein
MIKHPALLNIFLKDPTMVTTFQVDTLSKLSSNIIKYSKKFDQINYLDADKLKGDLFEIFSESFFQLLGADNRIGVDKYQPALQDDYGVDGQGIGMDGKPLTVQVKFRSDATQELTQDDIKQFAFQSIVNFNVEKDTKNNMIVFTNAKGLHWVTDQKVFAGRIRTLGYEQLSQLVNGNSVFWNRVNELVVDSLKSKGVEI